MRLLSSSSARLTLPLLLVVVALAVGCTKKATPGDDGGAASSADPKGAATGAGAGKSAPDDDDLYRWARRDGIDALMDAAKVGERKRPDVYRALGQAGELRAIAFLAEEAKAREKDAQAALEAANDLAATPRKQGDPEDVEELRVAADALLWLAKEKGRPTKERALAISTLRMLVAYGCVRAADIPTDLDPK